MKSKLEKDAQEELDEWEKLVDFFTMQVRK